MKAGDILIASGITVGSLVNAGSSLAAEKRPPGSQATQVCTDEDEAAFHQYLLEQGLEDMEGILGDGCSEFNMINDYVVKHEDETPKPVEK